MFFMTRKRWVGISSVLTMALVLVLMLTSMASAAGPVVHRVSVGGPDACAGFPGGPFNPGCDANFSLVAIQHADGSVSGQYTDRFPQGDGFHAVVDCVSVDGNDAWISGVITQGRLTDADTGEVTDLAGMPVSTRVRDNGTSANSTPDQIGYSIFGEGFASSCLDQADAELFDAPQGQVKVN